MSVRVLIADDYLHFLQMMKELAPAAAGEPKIEEVETLCANIAETPSL